MDPDLYLEEVRPSELAALSRRGGGKSAALVTSFLAQGMAVARVRAHLKDGEALDRFAERMANTLGLYCRKAKLPVKVLKRGDDVFLARTDLPSDNGLVVDA